MGLYQTIVIPIVEGLHSKQFDQIPNDSKPVFGFVVGGFSAGSYLSEVWCVVVPVHNTPNSAQLMRNQGDFSANWYALYEPIERYLKGFSRSLMQEVISYFEKLRGSQLNGAERQELDQLLAKHEFGIPFAAMPMPVGIAYTRFLEELVVNHHRFAIGAPVVGGRARIGAVTYQGGKFEILE